jgi:hypothetical protein
MSQHQTCGNCRFADKRRTDADQYLVDISECRKRAPRERYAGHEVLLAKWPLVKDADWCGEYEPRATGADET